VTLLFYDSTIINDYVFTYNILMT